MGREHLEKRAPWQDEASIRGRTAEDFFKHFMEAYFTETDFEMQWKPKDLSGIYGTHESGRPHGIQPECVVRNSKTNKAIYVEIKRQRAEGNAHERACKYFAPGIISSAQEIAKQPSKTIPFWWVFTNGIAVDFGYRQEILHWFRGVESHVLLWQDITDYEPLIGHFENHIRPLLM